MKVEMLVSRYPRMIGLARYTVSIRKYLAKTGLEYSAVEPGCPLPVRAAHRALRPFGKDVETFFNIFPLSAPFDPSAVKHFTTQMMGSLLFFQPGLSKVVVTVHDIVPYMMRDDPEQNTYRHFYDRMVDDLAMQNLRRADRIIAISSYTRQMLVENLGCSEGKIRVVLYGLDHETFRQVPVTAAFRARYGLDPRCSYLLYVGSENPRKNLPRLLQAFAKVKEKIPNVKLLKVGTPEYIAHYQQLQDQIRRLGLQDAVVFINHPPQEDLVAFYNAADLFVFPSLYEGFGMPPLEAMACGSPVLCSNTASLPEVVGDAAITLAPCDVQAWADAIERVLVDADLRQDLRARGLARAGLFTWERTANQTLEIYKEVDNI